MMRIWILKIIRTMNRKESPLKTTSTWKKIGWSRKKNGNWTILEGDVGCEWVWRSQILDLSKGLGNSWYKNVVQHYQIFLFKYGKPCYGRTFQPWRVYSTAVWVGTQEGQGQMQARKELHKEGSLPTLQVVSFPSSLDDSSLILAVASWLDFRYALYQMKLCLRW